MMDTTFVPNITGTHHNAWYNYSKCLMNGAESVYFNSTALIQD